MTKLCGDIVSKKFLFIGFSFEDPNLDYILSKVRIEQEKNPNSHYCIMKNIEISDFASSEEYEYCKVKFELKLKDMCRYGINTVLVDSYSEITEILSAIKNRIKAKNIFISGSAYEYGDYGREGVEKLVHSLSTALIYNGFNIISGYGLGIGSSVISGAIEEIYRSDACKIEERLLLRPFPIGDDKKILWSRYRQDMISNAGIAIFLCGNKKVGQEIINANGMLEEFEIALENNVIPIPIPATGYAAKDLFNRIMGDFDNLIKRTELKSLYEKLSEIRDTDELIMHIIAMVKTIKGG